MARENLTMSEGELFALPVTVDVVTAGKAFGYGRTKAYELARADKFPVPVLQRGARFVVTKVSLLKALGYEIPVVPAEVIQPAA